MIIDRIENWNKYFTNKSNLYMGVEFILWQFNEKTQDGRYEIKGNDIYALVQSYRTDDRETKKLEGHKKHIDIQYIVSGKELIEWAPVSVLEVMEPYSVEKDVIFYHNNEDVSSLLLTPGIFAVFYPEDAHRPGCIFNKPELIRKIVIKIRI